MLRRYVQRFLFVNPVQDILLTCGNFDSVIYGRALRFGEGISFLSYLIVAPIIVWGARYYRRYRGVQDEERLRKLAVEELGHRLKNKIAMIQSIINYELREQVGRGSFQRSRRTTILAHHCSFFKPLIWSQGQPKIVPPYLLKLGAILFDGNLVWFFSCRYFDTGAATIFVSKSKRCSRIRLQTLICCK